MRCFFRQTIELHPQRCNLFHLALRPIFRVQHFKLAADGTETCSEHPMPFSALRKFEKGL